MTNYNYTRPTAENQSKAVGIGLAVSFKQSYEVANFIRGKNVQQAKQMLEDVINMKRPVPMKRFNKDTGHKHGMAAGRYTTKTCAAILKLVKSAEANAQFKGLSSANLVVTHIAAQKGPKTRHFGRQRGIKAKRAHIEVILSEQKQVAEVKPKKTAKAPVKKTAPKPAAKPASQPKPAAPVKTESKPAEVKK